MLSDGYKVAHVNLINVSLKCNRADTIETFGLLYFSFFDKNDWNRVSTFFPPDTLSISVVRTCIGFFKVPRRNLLKTTALLLN